MAPEETFLHIFVSSSLLFFISLRFFFNFMNKLTFIKKWLFRRTEQDHVLHVCLDIRSETLIFGFINSFHYIISAWKVHKYSPEVRKMKQNLSTCKVEFKGVCDREVGLCLLQLWDVDSDSCGSFKFLSCVVTSLVNEQCDWTMHHTGASYLQENNLAFSLL